MSANPSTSSLALPARRSRPSRARKPLTKLLPCCLLALSFASLTTATTALSSPNGNLSTHSFSNLTFLVARAAGDEPTATSRALRAVTTTSHRGTSASATVSAVQGAARLNSEESDGGNSVTVIMASGTAVEGESMAGASGTATTTLASAAISTSTTVPASYTIPRAFDTSLGSTFLNTNCPSFIQTFLATPTFISCAPFSHLLTTSSAFFKAQRSPYSLLPFILDASCTAPVAACTNLMTSLDTLIRQPGTCGPDLAAGNALATQAQMGFSNYPLMRETGCQKDSRTGQYCFAQAAAEPEASELYFYYLAEGTNLPSGVVTSCSSCTQGLLETFSRYATNTTLPISKTYSTGRSVAAQACGPSFAPFIASTLIGAASFATVGGWIWSLVFIALGISAGVC